MPVQRDSERIYDEFLVTACATGDRAALDRLVARWQPRLLRHAWRVLGDSERARDVVQEAWMEILRGIGRLDDVAAFPAWSYRIVSRRCYRALGRTAREPFEPEEAGLAVEPAYPGHTSAEFASDMRKVMAADAALPPPQRAALALFHLEGMGVAEIAVALDVPPGTVKTRLMHARRKSASDLKEVAMDRFDEMIGRAMGDEDRALLARYAEQGYMSQAVGLFRGPMGAVMGLVYASVLVTFAGAAYAFWRMATAVDATAAVQWGVGALVLFQMTALSKSYMGSHLEANRMLREIKRLEVQVSLLRGKTHG